MNLPTVNYKTMATCEYVLDVVEGFRRQRDGALALRRKFDGDQLILIMFYNALCGDFCGVTPFLDKTTPAMRVELRRILRESGDLLSWGSQQLRNKLAAMQ